MEVKNDVVSLLRTAREHGISVFQEDNKLKLKIDRDKTANPKIVALLKDQKQEILDFLNDGMGNLEQITHTEDAIKPFDRNGIDKIPLSFSQEQLWFIDQLEGSVQYHQPMALHLKSRLDKKTLEAALSDLITRHEVLRTVIRAEEGKPYQVILLPDAWKMGFSEGDSFKDEAFLVGFIESEFSRPFNLSDDYMLRAHLIRIDEEDHVLILVMHHIVSDGWSKSILVKDLAALYSARLEGKTARLPPLPIQYADYAFWLRNRLSDDYLTSQLKWWETELKGVEALKLPTDFPYPAEQSLHGASTGLQIDKSLADDLKALTLKSGGTLFMTLLTAFKILLYRYSGQEDICVGTPLANRNRQEIESLVGFFINSLALRDDLSGNPGFSTLLERVKSNTLSAFAHQETPFEQIVRKVTAERSLNRSPLIQVMFVIQNIPEIPTLELGELNLADKQTGFIASKFELTFVINDHPDSLSLEMVYCKDLFLPETIQRLLAHYQELLKAIVRNPDEKIDRLSMITDQESQLLLYDFNKTEADYPKEASIIWQFEACADLHPNRTALVFGGKTLTYSELDKRSTQLARFLQSKGIKSGDRVGMLAYRGFDMMVSIFSILKCGAIYVPLNTDYPTERLAYILHDAQIGFILCTHPDLAANSGLSGAEFLYTDQFISFPETRIGLYPDVQNGAYIMYTSGTTGEPKGILVSQQNILKLAHEKNDIAIYPEDRVLQWSNFSFDGSTYDIYNTLLHGASLYLITEADAPDAKKLSAIIREHQLTISFITTALFNSFVDHDLSDLKSLRKLLFGGELVSIPHVRKALEVLGTDKIVHMYGPTETTVYATCYPINQVVNDKVPIGRPLSNTTAYVLNEAGLPAGIGVVGQIYIGGHGVSLGYQNQEKLNAEKFVENPFEKNQTSKLYKTGDLVIVLPDGNIDFIGRKDTQVKIRGYRIELGEIETILHQCPGIIQGVVQAKEDSTGAKRLIAYVVPESTFDKEGIQRFMKTKLPDYMVPALIMPLEKLPLNPNGKVDKKALPAWDASFASGKTYVAPGSEKEQLIASIWEELLQMESISVQDNFFEIGGHSLLAMRVVSAIRKTLGQDLSVRDVFMHPTIESLTRHLESNQNTALLPPITPDRRPDRIPLSYSQERLWFIDQLGGSTHLHVPTSFRLKNKLDKAILETALADLVNRHEVLRTVIRAENGNAYQEVIPADNWTLEYRGNSAFQDKEYLNQYISEAINQPFDLSKDYMLRAHLLKCAEDDHVLLLVMHHIASDGWSISLLAKDLVEFYSARQEGRAIVLPDLPVQYADYAIWQRKYLSGSYLENQLSWWATQLQGVEPLVLATDYPRPAQQSTRGGGLVFYVEKELTDELKVLSLQSGATLYMTLLSAFSVLLSRYSGQKDICIGMPLANREQKEVESLVGFFINTLVLRTDLSGNPSFRELLEQVKASTLSAFARQGAPFEKVVEKVVSKRDLSYNPLFQVLMVLQNTPDAPDLELGGLELSSESTESTTTQYDLAFSIRESTLGLKVAITYRTDLFAPATINRLAGHFQYLLAQLKHSLNLPVDRIRLLNPEEELSLLHKFNQTEVHYSRPKTLLAQFEEQLQQTPGNIAAVFGSNALTYAQLEAKANQWAHVLSHKGVKPGDLVGISLERSLDMIISILAVYKVGAAYLPIDPRYPEARIAFLLEDAKVGHVLTHAAHLSKFPLEANRALIVMDAQEQEALACPDTPPGVALIPEDVAYVIYTSGSTGNPKGVIMSHGSVVNQGYWAQDFFDLSEEDVVLQRTTFCFDPSVWEFFWPLSVGGKICFAAPDMEADAQYLIETIAQNQVTIVCLVPSLLTIFLQEVKKGDCPGLKRIICGGEILQKSQVALCREKLPHVALYNIYGPTETAIHVTCLRVPENIDGLISIPIGKPLSNVQLFITDEAGQLAPEGVVGELCIGGVQLANGYLNHPELTREKFVVPAFEHSGQKRIYRTGDLARWLPDGNVEYIGRRDNQLKINGFRIELGEVEYLLNQTPGVRTAVVLAWKDQAGSNRLVAYIVPENIFEKAGIEASLQSRAPAHMIPAFWVALDALPLGPTGKVDRKALPDPDVSAQFEQTYVAPENDTEKLLVSLWMEVLPVEKVGIDDNFFEIGGHSILAMRLIPSVRREFGKELKVGDVFMHPTIRKFAQYLAGQQHEVALPPLSAVPRPEKIPLSYSQERLWFVDQLGGSTQFHIPSVLRLKNELDKPMLETALRDLVCRHEVLCTTIKSEDGEPYQNILPATGWEMGYSEGGAFGDAAYLNHFIYETINRPFDLANDYMLRAHLIRCSGEDHVLILVVHHIAADGWSVSLLVKDLTALYRARWENRQPDLPTLPVQYADFAIWQRRHLSGVFLKSRLDWWEQQLRGVVPISLPLDYPRPARQSVRGASTAFMMDLDLSAQIKDLALKADASLFMTLLTAFKILLYRYSGQEDICIGTSLANRNHKEVENLAGFFINSLVLRTELSGNPDFFELLERVKQTTLSAFAHQEVPFEQIVDRVESNRRNLSRTPVFQILFTLQNTPEVPDLELGAVSLSSADSMGNEKALYDLSFYLTESAKGLRVGIVYCRDLFSAPTIEKMGTHYHQLLKAISSNPNQKINQLSMHTGIEEQPLQTGFYNDVIDPKDKTIVDLFEEQAARTPDNIAVVFEGTAWTYRTLNEKANRVAHYLQSTFQVQPNDLIGIMMESSEWSLLAVLSVLKSGAGYVPVDIDHPLDRKKFLVKDTGIKALIIESAGDFDSQELDVCLFPINQQLESQPSSFDQKYIKRALNADDLAYVIYTSGSTGNPKGVMVTHRNITNYVYGLLEKVDIQSCQTFGLMSTMSADLGNTVLYSSLLTGGALHLFSKRMLTTAEALLTYFRENPIDCIKIVPSHWKALETESGVLLPRQTIIFGGEVLPLDVIAKIRSTNPALEVINHYGPTEATIGKLLHRVNLAAEYTVIPIGRPFADSEAYIVDEHLNRCPVGVPGELLLGGDGIAKGYLNRPELTEEKFIPNIFGKNQSARLYRTGDLVRQLANGNIEFIGRKDDQVKIRGHRVELGEVEHMLNASEVVKSCAVLAKPDEDGALRLVAYIVPQHTSPSAFDKTKLQVWLSTKLPDFMMPAFWVELEALPLTSNGKVNRKALPDPEILVQSVQNYLAPQTETEQVLANIWKRLLKLDEVGIHDNFFEVGGHSLLAIRVISAVRKELQKKPDIEDIFNHPTIEKFAQFLDGNQDETGMPALVAGPRPDYIPLSFAQERLWFIDQFAGSVQYHMPSVLRLGNKLNREILQAALSDLVSRHEILRTVYKSENGQPYQVIMPADGWKMAFSDEEAFQDEAYLRTFITREVNRPFELSQDYMLRAHLIKCQEDDHILILGLHHIASDGWSTSILVHDLMEFYSARQEKRKPNLVILPIQYADYAIWQRKNLSGEHLAAQLNWWETQLKGLETLNLPTDYPRPAIQSSRGASISFYVDKPLTDQLNTLSLQSGTTLFMTLVAAFKVMMYRYSGQADICIGSPLANRNHKEVEPLVGCFLNALILRSDLNGNPAFTTVLEQVKSTILSAFKHQQVPFEQIVDRVETNRSLSHSPLFQVLFSLRNTPEVPDLELGDLSLSSEPSGQNISQLDLAFYVTESPKGLRIVILYCSDLFSGETAERMAAHYRMLLKSITSNPVQCIDQLQMLPEEEEQYLRVELNSTATLYPTAKTLVHLFEEQAAKTPDRVAVRFGETTLTYHALNEQANLLAAYLKKTYQLQADDLVGIMTKRSDWAVVAMLGIMKAGAAFVPIDDDYPKDRKTFIIQDTKIKALIVQSDNLFDVVVGGYNVSVFAIDLQLKTLNGETNGQQIPITTAPQDLAYVIYTSGSTGMPKGVMVEHGGIVNTILSQKTAFGITETDRCLQFFSLSFDASVLEIFTALLSGASLYIIENETKSTPAYFSQYLKDFGITIAALPPAYLNELDASALSGLKTLITGGDAAAPEKINEFLAYGSYCNSYGPTETSICATIYRVEKGGKINNSSIPLGQPVPNAQIYLTDPAGNLLPKGAVGELCVSGAGIARGYLNKEALTTEKFANNPFSATGGRLYKTGDLARWLPDGNLEFLGRKDEQVKIRGHRVEPGEIETALLTSKDVKDCAVIARPDSAGNLTLVAYVIPATGLNLVKAALQGHLSTRLPDYMVPTLWVELETLPLTSSGKVDKNALPEPDLSVQSDQEYIAPRNETEQVLANIWMELLRLDKIGIHDSFFALGGHSLLAVRLTSAIKDEFALNIPLKVIFEFPTIDELQRYIHLIRNSENQEKYEESEAFEL